MKPVRVNSQAARRAANAGKTFERDPNRLYYPTVRFSDENVFPYTKEFVNDKGQKGVQTDEIKVRLLPDHSTKNPNGYVQIIKMALFDAKTGKKTYVVSPATLGEPCVLLGLIQAFDEKLAKDRQFADWWDSIDVNLAQPSTYPKDEKGEPIVPDETDIRDAIFKRDYLVLTNVWNTYLFPCVMWAESKEVKKPGSKWADIVGHKANAKSQVTRTLELSETKMARDIINGLQPVVIPDDATEEEIEALQERIQLNHPTEGCPIKIVRKKINDKVTYEFEVVAKQVGPLPKDIVEKLQVRDDKGNDTNYPDTQFFALRKKATKASEVRNLLKTSTLGEVLIEKGLLSFSDAPVDEDGDEENALDEESTDAPF